ncbi:hypothetical protein PP175_28005 (plasmid) [Aneurinibacillus sp. Ricciae_BoGa-3]|uniref:hypothetical protein n=1 Tax=Aneurinibacillus sp. Ricciae_BoGa-3 TaxID=3022697 RepID=UPI002340B05E|nr:hypothetical protein [Aneurinibacillus sp. Ricciae_BoGa-3]WCK57036.1 hypothetical protein PP175_28005 [Aneurinibacillus sp. Ricciae_BoGa-3]
MINLAGVRGCDKTIRSELKEAGITPVHVGMMDGEVPTTLIGKRNNFIFQRGWSYWMVEGYMPLVIAQAIHKESLDRHLDIRVAGNSEDTTPEEWAFPKDLMEQCASLNLTFPSNEDIHALIKQGVIKGERYVDSYHIDTQEGLNFLVEMIKKFGVIG